jgi:photosystem II stability/assembly factor-like uncharacterized protein
MRQIKQIMITAALSALVILAAISFPNSSQAFAKYSVKAKHKHAVHKHRVKHEQNSVRTSGAAEMMKEEQEGRNAPDLSNQWFERHKDLATGTIPLGLTHSWHEHDLMMESGGSASPLASPLDTVVCLGPFKDSGPCQSGGRTRAVLVSAADLTDHTFFAGGVGGGLWKSTNAGSTWTPINDNAENLAVNCITQSPLKPDTIYYGTGEPPSFVWGHSPQAIPGDGVFKSTDGGNTFTNLSSSHFDNYIWSIAHSARDANTVYVGTDTHGLRITTDGGTTWSNPSVGGTSGTIGDILAFPTGSGPGTSHISPVLVSKNNDGLYYYNGSSYTKIIPPNCPAYPTGGFGEIKLANCKTSPNVVYAAIAPNAVNDTLIAFWKSTDGGATWTAETIPSLGGDTYLSYNMLLGVNPNDSDEVIYGGISAAYTKNGGATWNIVSYAGHSDHHGYSFFNSTHEFLISSDGGVYHKNWDSINSPISDSHATWDLDTTYVTTLFWGGDYASAERRCLGITQDNGLWRFSPDLVSGLVYNEGTTGFISQQDSNSAWWVGASGHTSQIFYTSSNFYARSGWTSANPSGPWAGADLNYYNFCQSNYADGNQAYLPTHKGIYRTTDKGSTWAMLNTSNIAGIQFIGCSILSNPTLYFTTNVSGVNDHFYRIATAKTFSGTPTDLSASMPAVVDTASFGEIAVYPVISISTTLYMCTTNYSSIPHIYKVTSANTATPTWTNITGDLPSTLAVNEVQADPSNSSTILAATDYGLYYTTNGGTNWLKDTRMPNVMINEMQLRGSDRKLFLFTQGRGVWYCSLAPIGGIVQQASVAPTLTAPQLQFSLYPNPATEKLTINPQQTLSSSARITIYSSDGRMISESPWNPTGEVNIHSLPSGVYFLQITDGNLFAKNKFIKQ